MFRHGARTFATSAQRLAAAAAEPSQHLINLSKAQGVAKGLTAGAYPPILHLTAQETTSANIHPSQQSATPPSSGSTTSPSKPAAKSSAKPSS
jgi:cysteine synthase A